MAQHLGGFRVLERMGRGASSDVFLVTDDAKGSIPRALKIVAHATPDRRRRMRAEFALLTTLRSPHLVRAYDYGVEKGRPFFTSEVVEGVSLGAHIRRHPGSLLSVAGDVLEALDCLHRKGLCHGDLREEHIRCTSRGATLIDFGLSHPGSAREDLGRLARILGAFAQRESKLDELLQRLKSPFGDAATALAFLDRQPSSVPPFIGRQEELKRAMLAPVALIHGEEGSGRTAFLEQLKVRAQLEGARVCFARPAAGPYGALRAALAPHVPMWIFNRGFDDSTGFRLAVTAAIQKIALATDVLVAFDDLEATDADSRGMARHLAEALPHTAPRCRVALAYRDGFDPGVAGVDVVLGPLKVAAVAEAALGGVPSEEFVRELTTATEGNASLLNELLADRGAFEERGGVWFSRGGVGIVRRSGWEALSPPARDVVGALAASPAGVLTEPLRKATGHPAIDDECDRLVQAGWIRPADDGWRIASAVRRRSVPEVEVRRWHRPLGEALEATPRRGVTSSARLEALAHHFLEGSGDKRGVAYGRRYAGRLVARGAFGRAAELYERCGEFESARVAWESAGDFPASLRVARRWFAIDPSPQARLALGQALRAGGELAEALILLRDAAAHAQVRVQALLELAQVHANLRNRMELHALLDELRAETGLNDRQKAQQLLAEAGGEFLNRNVQQGVALLERGVAAAKATGDQRLLWRALQDGRWLNSFANPRYFEAERFARQAAKVARHAGLEFEVATSQAVIASLDQIRGRLGRPLVDYHRFLNVALRAGHKSRACEGAHNLSALEVDRGRPTDAVIHAVLAERLSLAAGNTAVLKRARCWRAIAHAMTGDFAAAQEALEAARAVVTQESFAPHAQRRAEALVCWHAGISRDLEGLVSWHLETSAPIDGAPIAVAAAWSGSTSMEAVDGLLSALRTWPNPIAEARLRLARALLFWRAGDLDGARSDLERSCRLSKAMTGVECPDILKLLLRSHLAKDPQDGLEFATKAYHAAAREGRFALTVASAERISALLSAAGRVEAGARWLSEAARVIEDRRESWFTDPPRAAELDQQLERVRGKMEHDSTPDATWMHRLLEIDRELLSDQRNFVRLLGRVLDALIELTGAERGVLLLNQDGALRHRLSRGINKADRADIPMSLSIARLAMKEGAIVRSSDAQNDERLKELSSVKEGRIHAVLCIPLVRGTERVGVVYLDSRTRCSVFESVSPTLVELLRERATLAILNSRLLDKGAREHRGRVQWPEGKVRRSAGATTTSHPAFERMIGGSPLLRDAISLLQRAAQTDGPVLILGETGAGKELAARGLHDASPRKSHPFVAINCAAMPANLLESELFGHVRGAFTGAERDHTGLFRSAEGGTLFLDEIGEMAPATQAKLLRALETGEVRPVGGTRGIKIAVRIVAATHRNLPQLVQQGQFRDDLYYRLRGFVVTLPPLRERTEDIPVLVESFLARFAKGPKRFDPRALELLLDHPWPGNVRELAMAVEALVAISDHVITPELVRSQLRPTPTAVGESLDLHTNVEAVEKTLVAKALRTSASVVEAAKRLGIVRSQLYRLMERHGLSFP